ncbi:NAD(P)-binding domain-containing protein [Nocardia miyunensis]|uniref:NAD(P)-binding domain-containing protein n=1 Tax=Nocardia miyunensis TaxID=282684 RepID=UPI00082F7EBE|nr:NAD(P)-binding domain-containing protein [Nocardia miyunensis]
MTNVGGEDIPAPQTSLRAGVVGLGMIGGGVAVSLVRRGRIPTVYDVRPDVAASLEGVPGQVATIAEVARESDVVFVAVVSADQAREVISGENGIAAGAHPGLVVVLLSTVSVEAVHELAELCASSGFELLDAGVTGGNAAAQNGLTVMVGGPDATVRRVTPVLEDFAKLVVHCGDLGAGMVTKLARNVATYSTWAVVREAAAIATAGGVSLDRLLSVLQQTEGGVAPLTLLQVQAAGVEIPADYLEQVEGLAQKDLAAAQEFAGSTGVELPITNVVKPQMRDVYQGRLPEPLPEDLRERGLAMMDRVYGPGFSDLVPEGSTVPSIVDSVEGVFGQVWSRPYLTLRDRRLLTLGVTAMLGRADLLEVQLRGAIANREFTVDQLREVVLHLSRYVGPGHGTVVQQVVERLIAEGI